MNKITIITETTVTEVRQKTEEFDWLIMLNALVTIGVPAAHYGGDLHRQLVGLAKEWPSCACGQLCSGLQRGINGHPVDYYLFNEGKNFYTQVKNANWRDALESFRRIESRTATLLQG